MGKDGSSGVVTQTSTIKLAIGVTQEWPFSIMGILILYSKNILGL